MGRMALCLALLGMLVLGGCSVFTVTSPRMALLTGKPCTVKRKAPNVDMIVAGSSLVVAGVMTGVVFAAGGEGAPAFVVPAGFGTVAITFLASAVHGYVATAVCRAITPGWRILDREFREPAAIPDLPEAREGARGQPCNWKGLPGNCQPGLMCASGRCRPLPRARPATQPAAPASRPSPDSQCRVVPRSDCPTGIGCATGGCVDPPY